MSYTSYSITIRELMHDIGDYVLPAIQREFVWPAQKIEALFESILRHYPIGVILRWDVHAPKMHEFEFYELKRDFDVRSQHNTKANLAAKEKCFGILDGQQRITSLYIGLLGSYIEKQPHMRRNNPNAYPKKKLCINLLYRPADEASDHKYQIKFLTDKQRANKDGEYWLPVGDILKFPTRESLRDFRRSLPLRDSEIAEDTLDTLWNAIFEQRCITYFAEHRQELDEVLRIFVRLNTGATPLSYSDLLLSLATATWQQHDAREHVYRLVDNLNKECGRFTFSKDYVLKTLLVSSDNDVRFRTVNIGKKSNLEAIWPQCEPALKITARLLHGFGFDGQSLSSAGATIPIAYYIYKRGLDDTFLTQAQYKLDRQSIRSWLLRVLLGRVFSGQTDQLLTNVRESIKTALDAGAISFPVAQVDMILRQRHQFVFTDEQVKSIIEETSYGDSNAFAVLALLFPYLDYQFSQFDIDHLHPAALLTPKRLTALGMSLEDVTFAIDHRNGLANLQLLNGASNTSKQDISLVDWIGCQPDPIHARTLSLIPNVSLEVKDFRAFYEARQGLLVQQLSNLLDIASGIGSQIAEIPDDQMETGDIDSL